MSFFGGIVQLPVVSFYNEKLPFRPEREFFHAPAGRPAAAACQVFFVKRAASHNASAPAASFAAK